ncbi:MAG TPA: carboxypeptidase-like regulatory domain-containing protein, partial [Vicinamibacterales bacterium]
MRKILVVGLAVFASLVVFPLVARAQGSITGAVKDPSGAVLPGVTVEVASPALIEQTRQAVTDSNGNYRIVDLPPGTYSATYTLTGFKTVRREGILIQGTFNATVSPNLEVGTLEETITVSGTPTVDVSNNTAQFVVDRDILDAIPTPVRNTPSRALLLPGTAVTPFVLGQFTMSVRGS